MATESDKDLKTIDAVASDLAYHAAQVVRLAQESTSPSLMELAVVFRVAVMACDEANQMYERAQMASKIRRWSPGK